MTGIDPGAGPKNIPACKIPKIKIKKIMANRLENPM